MRHGRRLLLLLLSVALLVPLGGVLAQVDTPAEDTYSDPAGRYSVPLPTNWTARDEGDFTLVTDPDEGVLLYFTVLPRGEGSQDAIARGWALLDADFALEAAQEQAVPSSPGVDETYFINYDTGDPARIVQAVVQLVGDDAFLLLVDAQTAVAVRRQAQVNIVISGWDVQAEGGTSLQGLTQRALTGEDLAAWASYVEELLGTFGVPGAAVAVVQNGEVIYLEGLGVTELGGDTPITQDTHMMIGSTGKSLTTLLMAAQVDAGLYDWDTPVREVYPDFAMATDTLSEQVTMRNLVCACTGVPRRDNELVFNAETLTAEDTVASLRTFSTFTDFGEAFQYSNQLIGTAGYVAGYAEDDAPDGLFDAYAAALDARVLAPIGMSQTTVSFDAVTARGDYATPHGFSLDGYVPLPLDFEALLVPVMPAGGHWSTARDMATYMVMQLGDGVAADGTRIVSTANLAETRQPQVPVSATPSYGLGWFVGTYRDLPLVEHGGNTLGFTSDFAFLPEHDLGVLVLLNGQAANTVGILARARLFDIAFDAVDEARYEEQVAFALQGLELQLEALADVGDAVDADTVASFLGAYTNPALGGITLSVSEDGRLLVDAGLLTLRLVPQFDDEGAVEGYISVEPPLIGVVFTLVTDEDGTQTVVFGEGVEGETRYTFTPAE